MGDILDISTLTLFLGFNKGEMGASLKLYSVYIYMHCPHCFFFKKKNKGGLGYLNPMLFGLNFVFDSLINWGFVNCKQLSGFMQFWIEVMDF